MARHLGRHGPRTKQRSGKGMGRIVTKSGQTLVAVFEVWMFRIDVIVVIVRRQHSVLAGTNRMMNRVAAAAAAQPGQDAATLAARAMGVAERSLRTEGARQEQAGENGANEYFRDRLHRIIRYAAMGR